jgi:hypothetical protein
MILIIITLGIIGLEAYALYLGHDGKLLLAVVGTLSTIAGWQLKKNQIIKKTRKFKKFAEWSAELDRQKEGKR